MRTTNIFSWCIQRYSQFSIVIIVLLNLITIDNGSNNKNGVLAEPHPKPEDGPLITLSTTTQFDDYQIILHSGIPFTAKLRVVEAIWAQLRADYPNDVQKCTRLYQQVKQLIDNVEEDDINVTSQSTEAARKLLQAIGERLRLKNAHLLAQLFSGHNYPVDSDRDYLCSYLLRQHGSDFAPIIFNLAIDQVYQLISPRAIAAHLQFALKTCDGPTVGGDPAIAAANVYETVTKAHLYLLRTQLSQGISNDLYLVDAAYYLRELRDHPTYKQQRDSLKKSLDQAVSLLPSNLRHLFVEKNYCLLNREYEEYIYTTNLIPIDDQNIYIFTWTDPYKIKDNGIWITHFNVKNEGDRRPQLQLTISLESNLSNNFLYLAKRVSRHNNIVASWRGGKAREGSHWTVQLVDGGKYAVLSQDGYIMCSASELYSEWRRYVYAFHDNEHTVNSKSCQWVATQCPTTAELAS